MSDDALPKRQFGGSTIHVFSNANPQVRACHTCRFERRDGDDRYQFWCEAAGESIDDALDRDDLCSTDFNWWEPKPQASMSALVRFKRWLIG